MTSSATDNPAHAQPLRGREGEVSPPGLVGRVGGEGAVGADGSRHQGCDAGSVLRGEVGTVAGDDCTGCGGLGHRPNSVLYPALVPPSSHSNARSVLPTLARLYPHSVSTAAAPLTAQGRCSQWPIGSGSHQCGTAATNSDRLPMRADSYR